ncbi:MAG: endonuclease III [Sphaerochaetaceae bacterium]
MKDNLGETAIQIYRILDSISPTQIVFLQQTDPFRLLISVILSAQTTDRQVNTVTQELFRQYPGPAELASADPIQVERIIRSTGFYRAKTTHIIATAQQLVQRFSGQVPLSMEELTALSGVGRKTANCIIGQIAGKPAIIVDTHFGRVVRRLGLTQATDPEAIEQEIAALLPFETHYRFSMAVNLHGRQICHAKNPACEECALKTLCASYPIIGVRAEPR